jgi:hypothetical protein
MVVAGMGFVSFALFQNLRAFPGEHGTDRRQAFICGAFRLIRGDNITECPDQTVRPFLVLEVVQCQGFFPAAMNAHHPFDEHLAEIITDPRQLGLKKYRRERVAFSALLGIASIQGLFGAQYALTRGVALNAGAGAMLIDADNCSASQSCGVHCRVYDFGGRSGAGLRFACARSADGDRLRTTDGSATKVEPSVGTPGCLCFVRNCQYPRALWRPVRAHARSSPERRRRCNADRC